MDLIRARSISGSAARSYFIHKINTFIKWIATDFLNIFLSYAEFEYMGQFAIALQMAFNEAGWSQKDAALKAGVVSQPTISRYLAGEDLPKAKTLEALIEHLPAKVREDVVIAYLHEQIPENVGAHLRVEAVDEGVPRSETIIYGRAPNGSVLRKDLEVLERLALKDPNLAKTINYMVATLEGRPLGSSPYDDDPLGVHEDESDTGRPEEKILANAAKLRKKKA